MALTVNTNLAAMNGINNLNGTQRALSRTFGRISSGMRVNSAADDAAGLGVAENLDAEIRSLEAARRNANDGLSVAQVAEGAVGELSDLIKRIRELAVQSSSDTLATTERGYIDTEADQLMLEIDRVAAVTNFNGISLFSAASVLEVQVGIGNAASDRVSLTLSALDTTSLTLAAVDLSSAATARTALTNLDNALDALNTLRSGFGAFQNRIESAMRSQEQSVESLTAAKSRIMDADFATETANMSKLQIMQQAGVAIMGQANQINQGAVRLLG